MPPGSRAEEGGAVDEDEEDGLGSPGRTVSRRCRISCDTMVREKSNVHHVALVGA